MSELRNVIREKLVELGEDATDGQVAQAVGFTFTSLSKFREAVFPLLADEVRRIRRERVRRVEEAGDRQDNCGPTADSCDPTADRAAWMAERFLVPGRESVTWGEATIDDHARRARYLEGLRAGLDRTITRHLEAIEAIQQANVTCLADLVTAEAAA